jgi:thymidylate kinase
MMGQESHINLKRDNMIVILEGPDGAGKTTLKKALMKHFNFVELIPKSLPTHKSTETMCGENATAINAAIYNEEDVILDRGWMSEDIYSKVLRSAPSRFTIGHKAMFERMALTAGVVVVLCNPGTKTVVDNISERGDEFIREATLLTRIIEEYKSFEDLTSLRIVHYNYRIHDLESILEAVWDEQHGGHTGKSLFGNGYAETLIVTKLDESKPAGYVPMISWDRNSNAHKLTEALASIQLYESDLAWTNTEGSALRNLVVGNNFTRVAYVGTEIALDVESALDGLQIDVRFIPVDGKNIAYHLEGWV